VEAATANFNQVPNAGGADHHQHSSPLHRARVIVAYRVSDYLTGGLIQTEEGASKIPASWNWNTASATQFHDELGELADAYNDMAGNLQSARIR